jgi:hypothetical protein
MTSLQPEEPVVISYREESNSQWDFINFIIYLCSSSKLNSEDMLILDNAAVHSGTDSWEVLMKLVNHHRFALLFLPAYSPELNPCELVLQKLNNLFVIIVKGIQFVLKFCVVLARCLLMIFSLIIFIVFSQKLYYPISQILLIRKLK